MDIKNEFASGLSVFGSDLDYAFLSGRFAYSQAAKWHSDIDIIVVLKPPTRDAMDMIRSFIEFYIDIHLLHNYVPDMRFPGEYITSDQVSDSIEGRGYDSSGGVLHLPTVTSDEYWMAPRHEYRAWRNMSAFNNGQFLGGNHDSFEHNRDIAWDAVMKFVALKVGTFTPEMAIRHIIEGGEGYLGISRLYEPSFSSSELPVLERTLEKLARQGFLDVKDGIYASNGALELWERRTAEKVEADCWDSFHVVDWTEARKRASDAYTKRTGNKVEQLREHC